LPSSAHRETEDADTAQGDSDAARQVICPDELIFRNRVNPRLEKYFAFQKP
jgi:hypothetical protein